MGPHDAGLDVLAATRSRRRVPARLLRLASDERLVDMLRGGSEAAFEALFDRHHRGVLGFCRHMLGSVEEGEDAVQHTFLAAYRELAASDKPIQLRPWLYAIARNRCLTVLRTRSRQAVGELEEPPTEHLAAEVERRHELRATSPGCRRTSAPRSCSRSSGTWRTRRSPTSWAAAGRR
jgi:RNA polymerase sigma factor (sigma-70 family)